MVVPFELTLAPFRGSAAVAAGLLTRAQLAGATWRRVLPDVYTWADLPLDHLGRTLAAGLFIAGRGAVSGRSAALLWGADVVPRGAPAEVTVPRAHHLCPQPGLVVHRSPLPPADLAMRAGIPVTGAARTAFDLARRLPFDDAVVAVDALMNRGLVTCADLATTAADHVGWPGLSRVRSVLAESDRGAESPMETRVRLLLVRSGLPRPETQVEVCDRTGRFVARLDLGYRERRLGIEYEGDHHRGRAAFQHDLRRLNAVRACGWTVFRFGPSDIYRTPDRTVALVRTALTQDRSERSPM